MDLPGPPMSAGKVEQARRRSGRPSVESASAANATRLIAREVTRGAPCRTAAARSPPGRTPNFASLTGCAESSTATAMPQAQASATPPPSAGSCTRAALSAWGRRRCAPARRQRAAHPPDSTAARPPPRTASTAGRHRRTSACRRRRAGPCARRARRRVGRTPSRVRRSSPRRRGWRLPTATSSPARRRRRDG